MSLESRKILQGLLTLPILILTVALLLVALFLLPIRGLVFLLAKLFRQDLDGFPTGLSATLTFYPTLNIMYYIYVEGSFSLETYRKNAYENILSGSGRQLYKRILQSWTTFCGYTFWRYDEAFALRNHLREYDYTGDLELKAGCTEDDATRVMGRLIGAPWKKGQSPWEAFSIPMSGPTPRTLCIFRHHHALMDGYSGKAFLNTLFQTGYEFRPRPRKNPSRKRPALLWSILRAPYDFAGVIWDKWDFQNNWHFEPVGGTRDCYTAVVRTLTLDQVREAKDKIGLSFAAVLMSILAGGLQRMFQEAQLPVPEYLSTLIPLPMPHHPGGLVNHAVITDFLWPIRFDSGANRAQKIQKKLNQLSSPALNFLQSALPIAFASLPNFLLKPVAYSTGTGSSVLMSIMPVFEPSGNVAEKSIKCLEAAVEPPGHYIGTSILTCGVNGQQRIVLIMDKRIFPSEKIFNNFDKFVQDELNSMVD